MTIFCLIIVAVGFTADGTQVSTRVKYASNATIFLKQHLDLRSPVVDLSMVFSPAPTFQNLAFAVIAHPAPFLKIALGDIFFSGFISRFRNPGLYAQNPLQSTNVPLCEFKFSPPNISNAAQEKQSVLSQFSFGDFEFLALFNVHAHTPPPGQSSFMFALNYHIFDTKKTTRSNALRNKSSIFLAGGQNFVHPTEINPTEEGFFPDEKFFEPRALRYFAMEGDFISPIFKIFLSSMVSESLFRKLTGFVRTEANLNLDFFNLKMKISYLGPDFVTEKNTFSENSLDFFINPQFNFFFFRRFAWELETGLGAQIGIDEVQRGENLPPEATFSAAASAVSKNFRSRVDFTADDCLHPENRAFKFAANVAYKPYYKGFSQEVSAKFTLTHFWAESSNEAVLSLKGSFRPMKEFKATLTPKLTFVPGKSTLFNCGAKVYCFQSQKKLDLNAYGELGFSMGKKAGEGTESKFNWGVGGKITVK